MQETYFLIDFENVGLKGLEGAQNLTKSDWVHLFSTRNAPKINTATLANFNATNLLVHEVPAKSQSVDMHLVSYLGYLLGSHETAPQIVILSNDTDYDDIVSFWKIEKGVIIRRRDKFQPEEVLSAAPKTVKSRKAAASKKAAAEPKAQEAHKETSAENPPVKTRRTRKARTAQAQDEGVKDSAKADEGQEGPEKDSAKADEGQEGPEKDSAKADASPKKSAKGRTKADDAQKKTAKSGAKAAEYQDKTTLNNAVLKTLSNAKYDNETVSFAASLVTKNFAEKGGKQTIYRTVISKFGQERGLAIYRHIQKLL